MFPILSSSVLNIMHIHFMLPKFLSISECSFASLHNYTEFVNEFQRDRGGDSIHGILYLTCVWLQFGRKMRRNMVNKIALVHEGCAAKSAVCSSHETFLFALDCVSSHNMVVDIQFRIKHISTVLPVASDAGVRGGSREWRWLDSSGRWYRLWVWLVSSYNVMMRVVSEDKSGATTSRSGG